MTTPAEQRAQRLTDLKTRMGKLDRARASRRRIRRLYEAMSGVISALIIWYMWHDGATNKVIVLLLLLIVTEVRINRFRR